MRYDRMIRTKVLLSISLMVILSTFLLPSNLIAGEVELDVLADQFFFDPDVITVKQGDKVILHVKSQMSEMPVFPMHGFHIPDLKMRWDLPAGETTTIEFTIPKDFPKGEHLIECDIYCGTEHPNMKGKLIVK